MTEPTEWQSDLRRAFAGLNEAFTRAAAMIEALKLREGEEGYLAYPTAWECAQVEYTWRGKHEAAEESAMANRARADRIRDANIRLCALREADRAGKDADDVLTGLRPTGVLITPREGTRVLYVSRPNGVGREIGYLSPYALGWNAYVYQPIGPAEFVGWYRDAEKAADVVDGSYPRWT